MVTSERERLKMHPIQTSIDVELAFTSMRFGASLSAEVKQRAMFLDG